MADDFDSTSPLYEVKVIPLPFRPRRVDTVYRKSSGVVTVDNNYVSQIVGARKLRTRKYTGFPSSQALIKRAKARGDSRAAAALQRQDYGSDFLMKGNFYEDNQPALPPFRRRAPGSSLEYYGNVFQFAGNDNVTPSSNFWPVMAVPDYLQWGPRGAQAIAATIPTNPASNIGQTAIELREGLPGLSNRIRRSASLAEKLAGKYLELEFGYKPLLSDLKSIAQTANQQEELLSRLENNAGKPVRRRYTFPILQTESTSQPSTARAYPIAQCLPTGNGNLTITTTRKTEWWFSAEYMYYFDRGTLSRNRGLHALKNLDQLFGIDPSRPDLIWNVMPWTWAADWVGNVGTVLSNMSALSRDSLVMRYGYIMCRTSIANTYRYSGPQTPLSTQTFGTVIKMRKHASPYGFGLNPSGAFSTRQWAILGALGITRGSRSVE